MWEDRQRQTIGTLAAIVSGGGPRVLFLHGVGLRAEAWGAQIDALAEAGFETCAPDMPGHGGSPGPLPRDIGGYAKRLQPFLDRPSLIVGHSMGAMIAVRLAEKDAGYVRGLVCANAVYRRNAEARRAVCKRADDLDGETAADPEATLRRWFGDRLCAERDACARWLKSVSPPAYKAAYNAFARAKDTAPDTLAAISCSALFVTGVDDPNSKPAMSEALARALPNASAISVPNAAHMLPMTHPDALNTKILALATANL